MEKQTKIILGLAAIGVVAYLVLKPKKAVVVAAEPTKIVPPPPPPTTKPIDQLITGYPNGLKEGDYIRLNDDATVYLLKNGKKLPITYNCMVTNANDKWNSIIVIDPTSGNTIQVGDTLVV